MVREIHISDWVFLGLGLRQDLTGTPLVETSYGLVVAYEQNKHDSTGLYRTHTVVSGYLIRELEPIKVGQETARRLEVDSVPEEQQEEVSQILKEKGYREPIEFR